MSGILAGRRVLVVGAGTRPTTLRAPYLTMAAETLRLAGMPDDAAAMAKRAIAEADAEREPSLRRRDAARAELRLAAAQPSTLSRSASM